MSMCTRSAYDKDVRSVHLLSSSEVGVLSLSKSNVIKSSLDISCASQDGNILFSGKDSFLIHNYRSALAPGSDSPVGVIRSTITFSLSTFNVDKDRSSRHLRQIDQIWCTNDGNYALILCSDNCVFLFR